MAVGGASSTGGERTPSAGFYHRCSSGKGSAADRMGGSLSRDSCSF